MPLVAAFEKLTTGTSTTSRIATLFNAGTHSSLLTPLGDSVTTEMQKQTASFITSGQVQVDNSSVLSSAL
ncbi:hypothetical protein [Vibrio harveyi]|uniref:hypothetical protein n=1 Tax=Vibrio harveyi TaxID=669 RepID=UPI0018F20F6A|nr:hypothetical protein [Vibrio harveyi]